MKFNKIFIAAFLVATSLLSAQNKEVTLEEIWGGEFRQEYLQSLRSLSNGKEYAVRNFDRDTRNMSVDVYSYKTGEKTRTLISSADIDELEFFQDYTLSEDESKVLLSNNVSAIYRRSSVGDYYVYDFTSKKLQKVAGSQIQEPTFSPALGYLNTS